MADEFQSDFDYSSDPSSAPGGGGIASAAGGSTEKSGMMGRRGRGRVRDGAMRAFRNATFYTKASYAWAALSISACFFGFRHVRYNHASVWLTCTSVGCTLELTPRGRGKPVKVIFDRDRIVRSDVVKVDADGNVMRTERTSATSEPHYQPKRGGGKGTSSVYGDRGPDEDGWYDSYTLVLREGGGGGDDGDGGGGESGGGGGGGGAASETDPDAKYRQYLPKQDRNSLSPLFRYTEPDEDGLYSVQMRMFNLGEQRRRARTMATRINAYARSRRHKLSIRETRNVPWRGIVAIVLGFLSFILSLLLGQFWEPEERPGLRRRPPPTTRRAPTSTVRGRAAATAPAPSGYGSYGGYRPQAKSRPRVAPPPPGQGSYGGYGLPQKRR